MTNTIFKQTGYLFIKAAILALVNITGIASLSAQSPEKMSYQAVIRNSENQLLTNKGVGMCITILQGSPTGTEVYKEAYFPNPQTNANGLVSIEIGTGLRLIEKFFADIDWSGGPYFIKVQTDPTGGTDYTLTGTSQLLSVPYALHAKTAESVSGDITYEETDPTVPEHVKDIGTADIDSWNASYKAGSAADLASLYIQGTPVIDMHGHWVGYDPYEYYAPNWNTAYNWGDHSIAGYVPEIRTISINGNVMDLTANRSWNVGTVTSVGLTLPGLFDVSGSPVTTSGNLQATLLSQPANRIFASPDGSTGSPVFRPLVSGDIPDLDWSKITTGKPTTLLGYGITDGVDITSDQTIAGNKSFTGTTTVQTPVNPTDAVTKAYVDALLQKIDQLESQPGIVKDVDGNLYTTVKIGNQVWMAENLKTTRYNDGTAIPEIHDNNEWKDLTSPAFCWYDNWKDEYGNLYGALYNWYAVNSADNGNRNICPSGWHVPSSSELNALLNYLTANGYNYDGSTTGNLIAKSLASTTHWKSSEVEGAVGNTDYPEKRNLSRFTALPGGSRGNINGTFSGVNSNTYFWSSTQHSSLPGNAYTRILYYDAVNFHGYASEKENGFSIRCIRD